MLEHPILFSPQMRQALQEGRKTQTRRVLKTQPDEDGLSCYLGGLSTNSWFDTNEKEYRCPYGKVGHWLWVKETFFAYGEWNEISAGSNKFTFYRHHEKERPRIPLQVKFLDNPPKKIETGKIPGIIGWYKKPSIFLERRDSRINLEITNNRVERVQDISEEDCQAEGLKLLQGGIKIEFKNLWNWINGKVGADGVDIGWKANPWVWAVSFKVIK